MNVVLLSLFVFELFLAVLYYVPTVSRDNINKRNTAYLLISFFFLFLVHAFKDPLSLPDLPEYQEGFYEVRDNGFGYIFSDNVSSLKAERLWHVICKIVSIICPYSLALFVLVSFVILSGYFFSIKRYSPFLWMSVLLVLTGPYDQSLFVVRQHLAMAIVLFSYPFIIEKRFLPFFIVMVLACLFHKTAFIFFPVYFVYHTKRFKWLAIVMIAGGYIIVGIIVSLLASFFETVGINDYDMYLSSDGQTNLKMGAYLLSLFLFRIYIMRYRSLEIGINRLLTIILFIGCLISVLGTGLPYTARLNAYYSSVLFLIIPNTAANIADKTIRSIFVIVVLVFSVLMWFNASDRVYSQDYRFFPLL